jgi:hypothetical protein
MINKEQIIKKKFSLTPNFNTWSILLSKTWKRREKRISQGRGYHKIYKEK